MKKADLLKQALETVEKRGLTYDKAENNFARIAALWTIYLTQKERDTTDWAEEPLVEADVAILMVLMKVARLMEKPDHLDSWLDIAGYAACGAEVSRAGDEPLPSFSEMVMETLFKRGPIDPIVPPPEYRWKDPYEHLDTGEPFNVEKHGPSPKAKTFAHVPLAEMTGEPDRLKDDPKPSGEVRPFKLGDKVVSRLTKHRIGEVTALTVDRVMGRRVWVRWSPDGANQRVVPEDLEHAAI